MKRTVAAKAPKQMKKFIYSKIHNFTVSVDLALTNYEITINL
jgi:hypothetical protein